MQLVYERDPESSLTICLSAMGGYNEKTVVCNQKRVLTGTPPCWCPDHTLAASRTVRIFSVVYKPPRLWYFVIAAPTKAHGEALYQKLYKKITTLLYHEFYLFENNVNYNKPL